MRRELLGVCVALALLTGGCLDGSLLHRPNGTYDPFREMPGYGKTPLGNARLLLEGTGCGETHMIVPANASQAAERLAANRSLEHRDGNETRISLGVVHCENVTVGNATLGPATIIDVGIPFAEGGDRIGRDDQLVRMMVSDAELAEALTEAGVPAVHVEELTLERRSRYDVATEIDVTAAEGGFGFEASATSMSFKAEIPFGKEGLVTRDRWTNASGEPLRIAQNLNLTRLGGLAGTVETEPGTPFAELLGTPTRHVYGYQLRYDARIGVLPAGA